MIHFFRDILDGPLYIVVVVLAVIFIMAIIGFLMERKQLEKKKKAGIAVVDSNIPPINPVTVEQNNVTSNVEQAKVTPQAPNVEQVNVAAVNVEQPTVGTLGQPIVFTQSSPINENESNK